MIDKQNVTKFLRYKHSNYSGTGCLIDDLVYPIEGDIFAEYEILDKPVKLPEVKFLPPCTPQKIICIGLNYKEHAEESTLSAIPDEPVLFFKPPSALIGHLDNIVLPSWVDRVDYEGELAAVISKQMRYVSKDDALDGVFGYTCVNDVTARTIQKKDKQWTRGKGFDTFCPVGPFIVKGLDAASLEIKTYHNSKLVQHSNTNLMLNGMAMLISYISQVMTLYPGDLISTGTPKGVGPMKAGDEVEIVIENIGTLKNGVIDE